MEAYKIVLIATFVCMLYTITMYVIEQIAERYKAPFRRSLVQEQLGKSSCSVQELGAALAEFEAQFERFEKKFDALAEKLSKEDK